MRLSVFVGIVLVAVLSLFIVELTHQRQKQLQIEHLQLAAKEELAVLRSELESAIYSDIFFANSLITLITVSPDSTRDLWSQVAAELFRHSSYLRNVAIAPDDVIRFVYPLKGNRKALGTDFRKVPEQWRTVERAREMQSTFLAGPVHLVQGGVGLIVRTPIFTDPPLNSAYWGSCSAVIDVSRLFDDVGIKQLAEKYAFAIRGVDGLGAKGKVFYGNERVFDDIFASENVKFPSGSWFMAIAPGTLYDSLPWVQKNVARLIGYPVLFVLLAAFITIYRLYHQAHRHSLEDELTRLPNRRYLMYTLEQQVDNVYKKGQGFTLINLDLDDFKVINDTYGHAAGDKVLIEISGRIRKALRGSDIVARVGGDEFLAILPRVQEEEDIRHILISLKQVLMETPVNIGDTSIPVRVSVGYAIYNQYGMDIDALMSMADRSMYRAKGKKMA
ncbi:sensor domain-containing diguanylate cyclase [Vibrio albus]|uniref:Sensor domain-containing diguanylate cyclase n=2 Tax=Vibrio albus TaxID=2200953 RepID=A0A2U3B7E1_9VIBR|nr:sensor domain-containing diguanylate cyclase [Vibrio albus]